MLDKVRAHLQAKIRHRRIMRAALQLVGDKGERTTSPVDLIALIFGNHAIEITANEALRFLGVGAAVGDIGSGVAGQVPAEEGVDGPEGTLDDAFGGGSVRRGGLDADAEALAGGGERPGDEDFASVDDDRLGQDGRPRRRTGQALVQRGQTLVWECARTVHAQDVRPGRPGGVRDGHFGEQQSRIDGFGRARAQHSGEHGTGGDVDGDGQLGAGEAAVVEEGQDVQAGGVDRDGLSGSIPHHDVDSSCLNDGNREVIWSSSCRTLHVPASHSRPPCTKTL